MNKLATLLGIVFASHFSACSVAYYYRDGKKFRLFNEAVDANYMDSLTVAQHRFSITDFQNADSSQLPMTQFVLPEDINNLAKQYDQFVLFIYYPHCPANPKYFQMAKELEKKNIPYLMLAHSYEPDDIDQRNKYFHMKNRNRYIIPSGFYFYHRIPAKIAQFNKQLSPDLASNYRDELMYVSIVIFKNGNVFTTSLDNSIFTFQDGKTWFQENL